MSTPLPGQLELPLPLFDAAEGRARRDAGMACAARAQGTQWGEYAYGLLEQLCRERPEVHTDDLAAVLEWHPASPNAMGAVWGRAIRNGLIERTGALRTSRQPEKHAHSYPIYSSLVYRPAHRGEYA